MSLSQQIQRAMKTYEIYRLDILPQLHVIPGYLTRKFLHTYCRNKHIKERTRTEEIYIIMTHNNISYKYIRGSYWPKNTISSWNSQSRGFL